MSKGRQCTTLHSFEELGIAKGKQPMRKQTKDKQKLASQREKFAGSHICPNCKKPMSYVEGTNIMLCQNTGCKGIKRERTNEETGEKIATYAPSFHQLDTKGAEIAKNIFAELD